VFDGLKKSASGDKPVFAIEIDFGQGKPESNNVHVKQGGVRRFYPINTPEDGWKAGRVRLSQLLRSPERASSLAKPEVLQPALPPRHQPAQ